MRSLHIIFAVILLNGFVWATPFLERYNYAAKLEPYDHCMSGAGQSPEAFLNFWDQMPNDRKPITYMHYIGLRELQEFWYEGLQDVIMNYHDENFVMLQIGLNMTTDGNPSEHYEQLVANGDYDTEIQYLLDGLETLSIPTYLRIGYEFNGVNWNGYEPATYIQAYRRIAQAITARDLEIATLWCYAVDGADDYLAWYPGDDVVDWWSIDLFGSSHLTDQRTYNFLNDAHSHNKPVAIGESAPRHIGVTDGAPDWDAWFVPYFDLIHGHPGIKMFSYINWNFANYPQWSDWGDARLEANAFVRDHFVAEMDSSIYLHSLDETGFRVHLGLDDNISPIAPQNLVFDGSTLPINLAWDSVEDESGIAHYIIRSDDHLIGYSSDPLFYLMNLASGTTHPISVEAMDRAGNRSAQSHVQIPMDNIIQRVMNGSFDQAEDFWRFTVFNSSADGSFSIDDLATNPLARVTINHATNTDWHIQLHQKLPVNADRYYTISYSAWANVSTTMESLIQMSHYPYLSYAFQIVDLSTEPQTFFDTCYATIDDQSWFSFMFGNSATAAIWIDDINVKEYSPEAWSTISINPPASHPNTFILLAAHPNPFNPSTTIEYQLPERTDVLLSIYDIAGREVQELVSASKEAGIYTSTWNGVDQDGHGVPGGMYFARLQAGESSSVVKMVVLP